VVLPLTKAVRFDLDDAIGLGSIVGLDLTDRVSNCALQVAAQPHLRVTLVSDSSFIGDWKTSVRPVSASAVTRASGKINFEVNRQIRNSCCTVERRRSLSRPNFMSGGSGISTEEQLT
jgi:hypothetical protein